MSVKIDIRSNIKSFSKNLDTFARSQVPNATRSTLNNTAKELREHIVKRTFPKAFTVRNKRFPNLLFRFRKATKDKLRSIVEQKDIDGRHFEVVAKSATGGIRKGKGRRIAVPTSNIRLTSKGVRSNRRPRNIINSGKGFVEGNKIFFQKNRRNLQLLYILKNFVKIKKTFPFERSSNEFVQRNLNRIFQKAIAFRINRARLR